MQEIFKILNISENSSQSEVEDSYLRLKNQYSKDRFLEGEEGNLAAKNLTKLENAYREYKTNLQTGFDENTGNDFSQIEDLIRAGKLSEAQTVLDNSSTRGADWHYYQSIVFYKKNWMNESKKQLEIAIEMDPQNAQYKADLEKLIAKTTATENQFRSGNTNFGTNNGRNANAQRQMGGSACSTFADCCTTWCIMETLCNCCTMGCR